MNNLKIDVSIQINKPRTEVFEAIVDPDKMKNYFIVSGTARLDSQSSVIWKFPEFDFNIPIRSIKTDKDNSITFTWDSLNGNELLVEINLIHYQEKSTIVKINEKSIDNRDGVDWLAGNTEGWSYFLAALKAYLEYGINLRKGAFEYRAV